MVYKKPRVSVSVWISQGPLPFQCLLPFWVWIRFRFLFCSSAFFLCNGHLSSKQFLKEWNCNIRVYHWDKVTCLRTVQTGLKYIQRSFQGSAALNSRKHLLSAVELGFFAFQSHYLLRRIQMEPKLCACKSVIASGTVELKIVIEFQCYFGTCCYHC